VTVPVGSAAARTAAGSSTGSKWTGARRSRPIARMN